jgi:hypothetical protein
MREDCYILAGNRKQAMDIIYQVFGAYAPEFRIHYVLSADFLRGINGRGKVLYVGGLYHQRKDYAECLKVASVRGFTIKYLKEKV